MDITRRNMMVGGAAAVVGGTAEKARSAPIFNGVESGASVDPVFAAITRLVAAYEAHSTTLTILDEREEAFRKMPIARDIGVPVGWSRDRYVEIDGKGLHLQSVVLHARTLQEFDNLPGDARLYDDTDVVRERVRAHERRVEDEREACGITAAKAAADTAGEEEMAATDDLFMTVPTTNAGLIAYVKIISSDKYGFGGGTFRTGADFDQFCETLMAALKDRRAS